LSLVLLAAYCVQGREVSRLRETVASCGVSETRTTMAIRQITKRVDAIEEGMSSTAAGEPDDEAAKARAAFGAGVDAFDAHDFESARAQFLAVYQTRKHPAVVLNLAWATLRSGRALESQRFFSEVLSNPDAAEKQRSSAADGLAQAQSAVSTLLGATEAQSPPPAAPARAPAAPGPAPTLPALPPPAADAWLTMNSVPPSTCILDGAVLGTTPRVRVPVKPGSHTVQFVPERGTSSTQTISIAAGETRTVTAKLAVQPSAATTTDGF
jgi:hypothetical protein